MEIHELRAASKALDRFFEPRIRAHQKSLLSPSVTPEKAFRAAIRLQELDDITTKLSADIKAMERKVSAARPK